MTASGAAAPVDIGPINDKRLSYFTVIVFLLRFLIDLCYDVEVPDPHHTTIRFIGIRLYRSESSARAEMRNVYHLVGRRARVTVITPRNTNCFRICYSLSLS